MRKKWTAFLCTLVLLVCMLPARAITAADVYFTAVNDSLLPLSMDTMPTWVSGVIYVPATTFDSATTRTSLGIYYSHNKTTSTITIYTARRMMVFDLISGACHGRNNSEVLNARAVTRNGRTYLPLEFVCDYFGLEDTYTYTDYGYLIRVKSDAASLNDPDFLDAAASVLQRNLDAFLKSQNSDSPASPPPVTPSSPSTGPDHGNGDPAAPENPARVYLGVHCRSGEGLARMLDIFDRRNINSLLLFDPKLLAEQDELVRQAIGRGHIIGLAPAGTDTAEQLTHGNRLLVSIARTCATAVLAPDGQRDALEADGWVCWKQTVDGTVRSGERASAYAQRIAAAIGTRSRSVYVTLDDSTRTAEYLDALLTRLDQGGCTPLVPVETRL